MTRVPVLLQAATHPSSGPTDDSSTLAIRLLGTRLGGTAQGGYTHIFVAIDKFTKWIEVKPVSSTSAAKAAEFTEEITHRFGVPNRIISDLGSSFTGFEFWDFCQDNCINIYYTSVAHPWCNGQVERANGLILQGLKAKIFDPIQKYGSKWIQELPRVVMGCARREVRPPSTPPSSWFTVLRLSSRRISPLVLCTPKTATKARPKQLGELISTQPRSTV
jgi:transposase InsO family protein